MTDAAPPLDPARIADLIAATTEIVGAELGALGDAGSRWRPGFREWPRVVRELEDDAGEYHARD